MKKRKSLKFNGLRYTVSKMRVELTRPIGHYPLKVARLPIPPPGQKSRAKDGTRTRDPDLGKVVLYQLSYFRSQFSPLWRGAFVNCGAKIQRLFELAKFFAKKNQFFLNYFFTPSRVKNSFWR